MGGTRSKDVKLDLGGWIVDRVTPQELLAEPPALESLTPLRIPLITQSIPAGGDVELRIERIGELAPNQPLTLVPLRCPEAAASPALLVIVPADNAEIIPDASAIKGLIPDRLPPSLGVAASRQPALVYREESATDGSLFAGQVRKREQMISVGVETKVTAEPMSLQVEQLYSYQVSHEPLSQLYFAVPETFGRLQGLRVSTDGEDLSYVEETPREIDGAEAVAGESWARVPRPVRTFASATQCRCPN